MLFERGVDISVVDVRAFQYDYAEFENFLGIIMNTGSVNLINITVHVVALNKNGDVLASAKDLAHLKDFPVGGKTVFTVQSIGEGFPTDTHHLLIAFSGFERQDWHTETQDFEILAAEGEQQSDIVWGTVYNLMVDYRNIAEFETSSVHASAILYNSAGRIIGACTGEDSETRSSNIPPSGEGEIAFSCKNVHGIVDHFEVVVEGSYSPDYWTTPTESP